MGFKEINELGEVSEDFDLMMLAAENIHCGECLPPIWEYYPRNRFNAVVGVPDK